MTIYSFYKQKLPITITCQHIFEKLVNNKSFARIRFLSLLILFYLYTGLIVAQTIPEPAIRIERNIRNVPVFIEFDTVSTRNMPLGSAFLVFKRYLKTTQDDEMRLVWSKSDELGFQHSRYQQYYRGIKVEYGNYTIHAHQNIIKSANGEFYPLTINTKPALTEAGALQAALNSVKAKVYKWQLAEEEKWLKIDQENPKATFYPKGELVICPDYTQDTQPARLAYKFDIYAQQPVSREFIYVDAHSGKVIHRNSILKPLDATGTAITKYSSSRTITTDKLSTPLYRLRGVGGRGKGIETYNMKNGASFNTAVDFLDVDNFWGGEHNNASMDNAALDAHWGAQVTYDYWKNIHGRNSYDDEGSKLKGYIHANLPLMYSNQPNNDNAFWDGQRMVYGDGTSMFSPLTSLDVIAHEIGHGITEKTADLVYSKESGALNEGFSDIWAACIEHYRAPEKSNWLIGEDITKLNPKFLRSMSNPNDGFQPDTYEGKYWHSLSDPIDYYGVHTNSGVINYWFYLLSQGGIGANDKGNAFSVSAITIEKAAKIAYRTLRFKLSPNDGYAIAYTKTIEAAKELYGNNSAEAIAVNNAWYAVGVTKNFIIPPPSTPKNFIATVYSTNQINLTWSDLPNESAYTIQYTSRNPYLPTDSIILIPSINVAANITTFQNKNLKPGTTYYYRIKASNLAGSSPYSAWIKATTFIPIVLRKSNTGEELKKTSLSKPFFPNPAKDKVTVNLSPFKNVSINILIYDLTGRLHRSFLENASHAPQIQIDISNLTSGLYLLKLQSTDTSKSYKLIKE